MPDLGHLCHGRPGPTSNYPSACLRAPDKDATRHCLTGVNAGVFVAVSASRNLSTTFGNVGYTTALTSGTRDGSATIADRRQNFVAADVTWMSPIPREPAFVSLHVEDKTLLG